ncbi:MAG: hypothetical protein HYU28_05060 [Actinobacteria bacterium]|nr:hypothetical protein [Actinomycetota bacterium]
MGDPAPIPLPLGDVTFAVLDLETTGFEPGHAKITEIGAAKYRRGELLETLATLVDPQTPLAAAVSDLTGIDDVMVRGAPLIEAVLPPLLEFVEGSVIVGHNVGFDRSFLDAALRSAGRPPLPGPFVDTLHLARSVLDADDGVANHQLETVALSLHTDHLPCHRALADALATADVLHALLERLAGYGVLDLEALLDFRAA